MIEVNIKRIIYHYGVHIIIIIDVNINFVGR